MFDVYAADCGGKIPTRKKKPRDSAPCGSCAWNRGANSDKGGDRIEAGLSPQDQFKSSHRGHREHREI
jgi:hypothetical protein